MSRAEDEAFDRCITVAGVIAVLLMAAMIASALINSCGPTPAPVLPDCSPAASSRSIMESE